jgi:hypothetical protein
MDPLHFDSIASSNIPHREKSSLMKWYDRTIRKHVPDRTLARQHHTTMTQALVGGGESLIAGGVLAVAHANLKNGLDVQIGTWTVPADGALGLAGILGSVYGGSEAAAATSHSAFGVLGFRKTLDMLAAKRAASGGAPIKGTVGIAKPNIHGEGGSVEDDPIIRAAQDC